MARHAESKARDVVLSWIDQLNKNQTWHQIMANAAPSDLDPHCGYIERVGLRADGFKESRAQVAQVVGRHLAQTYGNLLSRPEALLELLSTRLLPGQGRNTRPKGAIVSLKVTPSLPDDPIISMVMQLSPSGEMLLCDISPSEGGNGFLWTLGKSLK